MSPKYKNLSSLRAELNGKVVEPGGEVNFMTYQNTNATAFQKISDFPCYNPIILAQEVIVPKTIDIPKSDNNDLSVDRFVIHFYVAKGRPIITFNHRNNDPPLPLYEGAKWNIRCINRAIDKIFIESKEPFSVHVIVERT